MQANKPTGETFSEGSDMPPMPMQKTMGAMKEICVPSKSLAMPGDDDKLVNPEPGDTVQFNVQGRVSRIEGDQAYVAIDTVNGDPVTDKAAMTNDEAPADEYAGLRAQAGKMMMVVLLFLLLSALGVSAQVPTKVVGDTTATNSFIATKRSNTKVFLLTGYTSVSQYIMVFGTNAVPANGAKAQLGPFPVSAGQFYSIDFGAYGADLDGVTICNSTTANTLTIGAADTTFQAILKL